jgi:sugar-specific transcriptional regulator TrmB
MEDAVEILKRLGLTDYEARTYVSLLSLGGASASEICSFSGIPYSRIYGVLSRLRERGWIEVRDGRPARYTARPPAEALKIFLADEERRLRRMTDEALKRLEQVESRTDVGRPDVWIIRGPAGVLRMAVEMVGRAESEILISIPRVPLGGGELVRLLSSLAARVSVKVLAARRIRIPGVEVRMRKNLFGGGVIVDRREVLLILGSGKETVGIWSNEPGLARFAEEYFRYLWGR